MLSLRSYLKKWFNLKKFRLLWLNYFRRKTFGAKLQSKVVDKDITIISQNCLGGIIYHDANLKFNSPTINMWIPASEFIELVRDLKHNLNGKLENITTNEGYPLGLLNGKIHIHFIHYKDFEEVENKWSSRLERVNYDNLRIVMTENDGCSYHDLQVFDELPFEKKVVFTHKPYQEFKSSFYIRGFEKVGRVSYVMGWKGFWGARRCDEFDWIRFLNSNK